MATRTAFHPWTESAETPGLHTRSLATPEFMLSMLNEYALGHNCPYLGVSVSVQSPLTVQELESRLRQAFIHTRWVYPAVACQIRDSKQMAYVVEDAEVVGQWASRTAQTVEAAGGWLPLHEKLSREVVLPSQDGDCAFVYAIVSPEEARKAQISQFHLLLHVHHGLADGAGLRSMMNEVLVGLAGTGADDAASHIWGQEVDRLSPAALDVAVISEDVTKALAAMPKEIPMPPLEKPAVEAARQGTGVVSHSFDQGAFLDTLLDAARAHDVKLTAVVQAALALAVHDAIAPTAEETCTVLSGFDLRARNLEEPWSQRNKFVGAAVGLEMMTIPVSALQQDGDATAENGGRFWAVARHMHGIWATAAQRKDVAAANELRRGATGFIIKGVLDSIKAPTSGVSLNFNYVSDPAGSNQLDGAYGQDEGQTKLVLDRYQLVTDESTAKLSCRSHSWNNTLSLCISFNNDRHQEADVQKILDRWVRVIEEVC